MNPRLAVVLGFNCFCLGAIIAQQLTKAGFQYLSLWMGLPALIIQLILLVLIGDKHDQRNR